MLEAQDSELRLSVGMKRIESVTFALTNRQPE